MKAIPHVFGLLFMLNRGAVRHQHRGAVQARALTNNFFRRMTR